MSINNLPIYPQNYTCSFRDPESGRVDWTTVGILPSNKKFYRVWNFRLSGVVYADPTAGPPQEAQLVYDFSGVQYQNKDKIVFKGPLQGTVSFKEKCISNSSTWLPPYAYTFDDKTQIVTFAVQIPDTRKKQTIPFEMDLVLNDSAPVTTTINEYTLEEFGGSPDGTTDNTTAWNSMVAAIGTTSASASVLLSPGTYSFSSAIAATLAEGQSITMVGQGQDVTFLYFPNNSGLTFTYSNQYCSVHVRDVSFTAGQPGTVGNAALTLLQTAEDLNPALTAPSDVSFVTFRGSDGYDATNYFSTGLLLQSVSNVNVLSSTFVGVGYNGVGISLSGGTNNQCVQTNITTCNFFGGSINIAYGAWTQGVTVSQSNFTGSFFGIQTYWTDTTAPNATQLTVTACQFNCGDVAINLLKQMGYALLSNNVFILAITGANYAIQGNMIVSAITGNTINSSLGGTTTAGIVLLTGSGDVMISGNVIANTYTGVLTQGGLCGTSSINYSNNLWPGVSQICVNQT